MADIRRNQGRLQEAHERSKMVTRSEEMKKLREQMQVGSPGRLCWAALTWPAPPPTARPASSRVYF